MQPPDYLSGTPQRALIDEPHCIGCTKCIQACPVDAIVGAAKQMHTVLVQQCTGCELCLPPCPVDCITLLPTAGWSSAQADTARKRATAREQRLSATAAAKRHNAPQKRHAASTEDTSAVPRPAQLDAAAKRAVVAAAIARAREKRAQAANDSSRGSD